MSSAADARSAAVRWSERLGVRPLTLRTLEQSFDASYRLSGTEATSLLVCLKISVFVGANTREDLLCHNAMALNQAFVLPQEKPLLFIRLVPVERMRPI